MFASFASRGKGARAGRRAALALVGCAPLALGSPAPFVLAAPAVIASVASVASARAAESAPPALPRQFSVEVGAGGVLFADGTRVGAPSELLRWAQRAVASSRYAGAVVFGDPEREAGFVAEALDTLRRAGFAEVRNAGRRAPAELSAALASGATPLVASGKPTVSPPAVSPPAVPPVASAPAAGAAAPARRPGVTLASVGLHVDGKLNQEPHRSRLVRAFEQQFAVYRRCHDLAETHAQGASFGVDLLIPKGGGRGKVRETRSRLENKAFKKCMHGAFESIRFAPPPSERPEIVSYSVLFKPAAR
jgi:hypothetical protein